uniref:flowering time control protein FPA-like isoform X2 n=1 Tax=Erigeron canadensis TaxID=72917 RepID=UPI001CB89938|nr:flowering time control protein FPA-like isoform X2 [Erigeron canadensis]
MRPPLKPPNQLKSSTTSATAAASNNLWVGNLSADVTDSDLHDLFSKHGGPVDSITCYPSRSYAFVNMKTPEDAVKALDSLQGFALRGGSLKIDFAKPAKPCKSLWVSGISISTSKEDLEQEFSKFGKIEDYKFLRDKNTAYIDYARLEDASKALKMMHGKHRGGSMLRVDYLRSHSKREQGPDIRDAKEGLNSRYMVPLDSPWLPDAVNNFSDPSYHGRKRKQNILPLEGRKGNVEQPSNVLVISYPPVVHIDEQMLHNAMILFGEIDNISSFPSEQYSLVEFRSVEEAQLAKDGLQGRLFNDPRISIMFASNEHAPNKDISGFHPGLKGLQPHAIFNELPTPKSQLDAYGHPVIPNNLHGSALPYGLGGPDIPIRHFAPSDSFDSINPMGAPNWRSSTTPGRSSSSSASVNPLARPSPGRWDVFDASQLHREPKRLRRDTNIPLRDMNDKGLLGPDPSYRDIAQLKGIGRLDARFPTQDTDIGQPSSDYIWRGVIAKGGTTVCHARCVPIRDWIGYDIPEVVNCSARTGLDVLAKHYTDAVGFDIVFFLPDSEEDFASYTEFVRYLGDRNRAGVAKFDDGTTLFLVPPSEFLSNVLNVSGPERLYGVVLKFPQNTSASTSVGPLLTQPQFFDKQQVSSQNSYNIMPSGEKVLQSYYSEAPHDDSKSKSTGPPTLNPLASPPPPPAISTSTPQTGLSLTPELIATLASLAKGKLSGQQPSGASGGAPVMGTVLTSVAPNERPIKAWEYEPGPSNLGGHVIQQSENIFHGQTQVQPQHQDYQSHKLNDSQLSSSVTFPPIQNYSFNMPQHEDPHSRYGLEQKPDAGSVLHTGNNLYGGNNYQPQSLEPVGPGNSGMQLPEMQQRQSALYATNQQPSDFDANKNERYQTTLQFATNLLLQMHQKQSGAQSGQGGGNH